ncbi:hypothetical protein [Streptomyces sp. NPDC058989]|uniref:hypothetical protein n=1 Tax=Streptomyces sp. NPDC058989 TaxID=3346686 RepID=UPI00367C08F2
MYVTLTRPRRSRRLGTSPAGAVQDTETVTASAISSAQSEAAAAGQKSFTYTPKLKQQKKNGHFYLYTTADYKALSGAKMKKICVNIWLSTMTGTKPIKGTCTDTIGAGAVTTASVKCGYALYNATVWDRADQSQLRRGPLSGRATVLVVIRRWSTGTCGPPASGRAR